MARADGAGDAEPDGLAIGEVKPSPSLRDISLKIAIKENLDILIRIEMNQV